MNSFVSGVIRGVYKGAVKPVLFRFSPDGVHEQTIRIGMRFQKHAVAMKMLRLSTRYDNSQLLSQTLHGITFPNPIGLSAGLDKNFKLVPLMHAIGFGFMEGGSITYRQCRGNPRPWFYRLPRSRSLVVHAGLANDGVAAIVKRLTRESDQLPADFPLNISIAKTNSLEAASQKEAIADYTSTLSLVSSAALGDMYTLNISCPNTHGGEAFTTPARLEALLHAIDELELEKPLFIKMPIDLDWDKFYRLLKVLERHTVAGVTIGNLTKRREQLREPLPASIKGHLSGLPTKEGSTYLVHQTYEQFGSRFTIIGVGGIFTAEDAYEKIRHGASLVELVTGLIFEGPALIGHMNRDLVKLLRRDGYSNVAQAIGSAHRDKPGH